jgi:hypothetical protein
MFRKPRVTKKNREIIHGLKKPNIFIIYCNSSGKSYGSETWVRELIKESVGGTYTVIRFASPSAKFAICTVVGRNGTLDKDKKIKCVNTLASKSVPFILRTVQMPNLALTFTVYVGWWYGPSTYVLFFDMKKGFLDVVEGLKHGVKIKIKTITLEKGQKAY